MFPLRDDNPTLHASVATFALVAINALAWVFVQGRNTDPHLTASVWRFGLIPGELLGLVGPFSNRARLAARRSRLARMPGWIQRD